MSTVQASPSSQSEGQLEGGSQVSPDSTAPLPQLAEQSSSLFALQSAGQQPSPAAQVVIIACVQAASQLSALPVRASLVQLLPSSQLVGQLEGGSQVSPRETRPSPQRAPWAP